MLCKVLTVKPLVGPTQALLVFPAHRLSMRDARRALRLRSVHGCRAVPRPFFAAKPTPRWVSVHLHGYRVTSQVALCRRG